MDANRNLVTIIDCYSTTIYPRENRPDNQLNFVRVCLIDTPLVKHSECEFHTVDSNDREIEKNKKNRPVKRHKLKFNRTRT